MGLFTVLFALGATIGETIKEVVTGLAEDKARLRYETIDWDNIESVTFDGTETAYRTEEEEEFDIVKSNFLSDMDGWAHYETQTVEYEVEDGLNYLFTIKYKDGTIIYRKFHEASYHTQRLLEYCNNDISAAVANVADALNNVIYEIGNLFGSSSGKSDYETAFSNFKQLQALYSLNENSAQEDFEKAAEIKITSIITSNEKEFTQSIYELMLYLLSTPEDGDILEKTTKDEFSFLQQIDNGIDAFAVLFKGQNVDNKIITKYDKARINNNYRKAVILTTGTNTATISNPNVIIWDIKKIVAAYINVFKKVVTEELPVEEPKINKDRFAVIDFETTGLNYNFRRPPMDEIISVSIIDQDENVLLDTYCDTVKIKSWYGAQKVNGISPRDVKGCPTFVELLPQVIEILSSYDYVISYNVPFEKSFLENYASLYTSTDFSVYKIKWGRDPMEMFMDYMGSRKFLKLETAAEHFGYTYNAHNSLEDTKAALYVYNALRDM